MRIEKNDVRGAVVNLASRVAQWASGPWIVLTDTAKQHIVEELGTRPSELKFVSRQGELKDFGQLTLWLAVTPEIRERAKERQSPLPPIPVPRWERESKSSPAELWRRLTEAMENERKK